jgi:hypothetical protein
MKEQLKSEIEEIDLKIAELKKRRRELLSELGEGRLSWGAIIAGAFGALMTGLGIIALFAANWDELGRAARAAVSVAPTLICGIVAVVASVKGWWTKSLWEPLGILWSISIIAGTSLVAQTYQVGGSVPGLVLLVALLSLPVVWVTQSATLTALWPVFAIIWGGSSCDVNGTSVALAVKSVVLMALSLPALIVLVRSDLPKVAKTMAHLMTGLVYSFGLALVLAITLPISTSEGVALVCIYWTCSAIVVAAGCFFRLSPWCIVGTIVACCTSLCTPYLHASGTYWFAIALAIGVIVFGVAKLRSAYANIGAVTFFWLILAKFFASDASFTLKGIVLISCGTALTTLNTTLVRFKKRRS